MSGNHLPPWLADTVLYQIFPPSFADGNGDGIGDLAGIEAHLDHLSWLGIDTVWLSPCFASPFGDAGYDVSDYCAIAPRYGTREDLARLVEAARSRGIRVLLDLVAGHTSDRHAWFIASANDPTDDRYIWAPTLVENYVPSPGTRPGFYLKNYYDIQPALNFGFGRPDESQPWRQPVDAPGPLANRRALRDILDFWMATGVAGFRVDMASSLVKDDPGWVETAKLWREFRGWLDASHRGTVLFAEWGDPRTSVPGGFHVDFFLHFTGRAFRSLWDNGAVTRPDWPAGTPFFDSSGEGSVREFLADWAAAMETVADTGFVALPSSNHDFPRLAAGLRTGGQLRAAFIFLLTWPTLPAIYYGDEIGMRFIPGLPDKEGSQRNPSYNRAGSRTPMQWDGSINAGFSTATADRLYLPIDPDPDRPTVTAQRDDPGSLLRLVRDLIAVRRAYPALGTRGTTEVVHAGYPFVYRRGGEFLVAINPRATAASVPLSGSPGTLVLGSPAYAANTLDVPGFGYAIYRRETMPPAASSNT
ncbi:MAG TPA: alpha-amylase family glycosyl hydrolase [Rugosimonospora sp.]|jgi:maltose alpha-D-glucosyltransferase/alpha-amylase